MGANNPCVGWYIVLVAEPLVVSCGNPDGSTVSDIASVPAEQVVVTTGTPVVKTTQNCLYDVMPEGIACPDIVKTVCTSQT